MSQCELAGKNRLMVLYIINYMYQHHHVKYHNHYAETIHKENCAELAVR